MKKTVSLILAALTAAALAVPAFAGGLVAPARRELNVISPLALVRSVEGSPDAALTGDGLPAEILVEADGVADFEKFFADCASSSVIPNIRVTEASSVAAIAEASAAADFCDITVISPDTALLALVRARVPLVRTGLETTLPNGEMTSKEAGEVRRAVRGAPATFCVIGPEYATLHNVRELQALALAVWVRLEDADPAAAVRAVLSGANGLVTPDDRAAADAINAYIEPGTLARAPLVIGHRGYESVEPQNSLASFRAALEAGADVIELDINLSSDGRAVVVHDGTIANTTDYDGDLSVSEMTFEEIRRYHLYSGIFVPGKYGYDDLTDQLVPCLEEVLDLLEEYPGRRVFIELKSGGEACASAVARIVKEYGMEDRVDVISFRGGMLLDTVSDGNLPGMATGYLGDAKRPNRTEEDALESLLDALGQAQPYLSTINFSDSAEPEFTKAANDRGMTVWPWTFWLYSNDRAYFAGSAGITTSDPGWASDMRFAVAADPIEVGVGRKVDPGVVALTYRGERIAIPAHKVRVSVIGDAVEAGNGRIVGVAPGAAVVVLSVSAESADGTPYVLACAVPVTVTEGGPGADRSEPDVDPEDPPVETLEGTEIFVSHLNEYNAFSNDAMIVYNTGAVRTARDLYEIVPGMLKRYIAYRVENRGGKYIATEYLTGEGLADQPAPEDGFLLFLCRNNRSYGAATGGKLLGLELVPDGFPLYRGFAFDTKDDPSAAKRLVARPSGEPSKFSDVSSGAYYAGPVTWATLTGITEGTTETTFSPGSFCTRAQAVTFLWRAAGSPEPKSDVCPFEDVKPGAWYGKAVLWAAEQGIAKGTGATAFSPDATCTRAQIVTFLWRAAGSPEPKSGECPFEDVKAGDWFSTAVLWASERGIAKGTADTEFSPSAVCTRAQIVTFLFRAA